MTAFTFSAPSQVTFGVGSLGEVGKIAAGYGTRALATIGARGASFDRLRELLHTAGVDLVIVEVAKEPDVVLVEKGVQLARSSGCDLVIGFGGGSAIDTGKAISALLTNPGEPLDYLEVVGKNQPLTVAAAPMIAIPTTAGTGSEVTRNAVLAVPDQRVKVSLRGALMMPRVALVDPELTYSLPQAVTASTGMDALTQVIEPYVSSRANAMTDLYCREGIIRAARSLLKAFEEGQDPQAREDMAFASLMGGLALANAGLGAVHGFAGPIGGAFVAPHGAVCSALLPGVVRANAEALSTRSPSHPALQRYQEIARWVTGNENARLADLVAWLENLRNRLGIPGLGAYGLQREDITTLVNKSAVASSMKANPIRLSDEELAKILEDAI